ncbi:serine hydrolase domain-containing protein [Salinigranum salinum]|uniref:serine hydrolase domain-containing protein n=1 Tax=Salinigranum salinum TaxID=1364937 RepID=UPI001260C19D|nr:serine hydrolase [Salinigranum salinum]
MELAKLYGGAVFVAVAVWVGRIQPATGTRTVAGATLGLLGVGLLYSATSSLWRTKASTDTEDGQREPGVENTDSINGTPRRLVSRVRRRVSRRDLLKSTLAIPAALSVAATLWAAIATVVYPRQYVRRVLTWRESDVWDYLDNFPQRQLKAAASPTQFEDAPGENRVADTFEEVLSTDDLETFLAETTTQAFIVVENGRIVYESYFNEWHRDSMVTSFSVAKSFVSTLVGIAIEEGHIGSLDDPITEYLPELTDRDPEFGDITVRHLLSMSSGLAYEASRWGLFNGDDPLTTYYPDQRYISLYNTRIADSPGEYFQYNKYHPQLLGMILERTTGMPVTEWTQTRLWEPLGMEFDGAWCLDSTDSGFEKMEAGLNARAIDFAKLGQLFLDEGAWNGEKILSADWVALATGRDPAGRAPTDSEDSYYSFMWWGLERNGDPPDFSAIGDHGQYIYVSPANQLVIVRTGVEYGLQSRSWPDVFHQVAGELSNES